jgi:hypothetical protein
MEMQLLCRSVTYLFAGAYAVALALLLIGSFGLLGSPRGPLAGVFLIPLGMPWVLLDDALPDLLRPAAGVLSPLLNLFLLVTVCKLIERQP